MFIVVDLDKTFLKHDVNWLLFKLVLKTDFFFALKLAFGFVFYGTPYLSDNLSPYLDCLNLDLFVNKKVLDFLELQKDAQVILATGSSEKIAQKIVEKFSVFSLSIGSSEGVHCVGKKKLQAIFKVIGDSSFFYIGDSTVDLELWSSDKVCKIGVVNPSEKLLNSIKSLNKEYIVFY